MNQHSKFVTFFRCWKVHKWKVKTFLFLWGGNNINQNLPPPPLPSTKQQNVIKNNKCGPFKYIRNKSCLSIFLITSYCKGEELEDICHTGSSKPLLKKIVAKRKTVSKDWDKNCSEDRWKLSSLGKKKKVKYVFTRNTFN